MCACVCCVCVGKARALNIPIFVLNFFVNKLELFGFSCLALSI